METIFGEFPNFSLGGVTSLRRMQSEIPALPPSIEIT
jgi:hypothetical protein